MFRCISSTAKIMNRTILLNKYKVQAADSITNQSRATSDKGPMSN
jgi:hypothetical protein